MPITTIQGVLEVDTDRGVVYFHTYDGAYDVTLLRICGLDIPSTFRHIDITMGHGASVI